MDATVGVTLALCIKSKQCNRYYLRGARIIYTVSVEFLLCLIYCSITILTPIRKDVNYPSYIPFLKKMYPPKV
jgi:hypothetical protein